MPRRVARAKVGVGRSPLKKRVDATADRANDDEEEFADEEDSSVNYWVRFKLWVAVHEHKWGAIFYAIFLLIFTLVVLKSQVIMSYFISCSCACKCELFNLILQGEGDSSYILTMNIRGQVEGGYDSTDYRCAARLASRHH
jgi:hypothetical protein